MANWGFVLVTVFPMLVAVLVLRRLVFGKDSTVRETLACVVVVWLSAALLGMATGFDLGFGPEMNRLEDQNPFLAWGQPALVVAIVTACMAWMRKHAGR